jgi:hypothetical protein
VGIVLVLAGNHRQYLDWVRMVYGVRSPMWPARRVQSPRDLLGISAADVDAFHQVGTYWENPEWGSGFYGALMAEGVALGKAWAMPWDEDYRRAAMLRKPVTPQQIEQARSGLVELIERLDGE